MSGQDEIIYESKKCITAEEWFEDSDIGSKLDRPTECTAKIEQEAHRICSSCLNSVKDKCKEYALRFGEDGELKNVCILRDPDYQNDKHKSFMFAKKYITNDCKEEVTRRGQLCKNCVRVLQGKQDFNDYFILGADACYTATGKQYKYPFGTLGSEE